jgi:hypothetical protein
VARPSRNQTLQPGLSAVSASPGGLVIAVVGYLTDDQARLLASSCHRPVSAIAVLLDVMTWSGSLARRDQASRGRGPDAAGGGSKQSAAGMLAQAGWQVLTITAGTPLSAAWGQLHRAGAARVGAAP